MATQWINQRKIVLENCNHDILTICGETAFNRDENKIFQYYNIDMFRKGVRTSHFYAFELEDIDFENLGHSFRLTLRKNGWAMLFLNNYGKPIKIRTVDSYEFFQLEEDSSKRDKRKE